MERFINFIYDKVFKARDSKGEKEKFEELLDEKIKNFQKSSVSDLNDPIERRYYEKLLAQIKNLLNLDSFNNYKILEMGSGTGLLSLYMAKEGAEIYLLDKLKKALTYSSMMYDFLRKKGEVSKKAYFIHEDIFQMDSLLEKFDIVHNSGVIEHYSFQKAVEIVKKMKKHTNRGGIVIVCVPNYFCPNLVFTWFKYRKGTERFISKKKLKKIMEKAGLKNVKIETSTFVYPDWFPQFFIQRTQKLENFLGKYLNLGFLYIGVGKND